MKPRRRYPTQLVGTPPALIVASLLFLAIIALTFVRAGVAEAVGMAVAFLPLVLVCLLLGRTWKGHPPDENPIYVPADFRKIMEGTAKIVAVEVVGLALAQVAPYASSATAIGYGSSFLLATLVGVTAWMQLAEVGMTIARGEKLNA